MLIKLSLWLTVGAVTLIAVAGTDTSSHAQSNCDPAYPTVCIPSPPPDLDCGEIAYQNFQVNSPDPHRFDGDKDGIGCEPPGS